MKTKLLIVLILLLISLTFPLIPKVSATTTEDLMVTYASEDIPCEPMPENYTTEDYTNTTNPYSQINPLGEETDEEGSYPLYVLVFGDEEARDKMYTMYHGGTVVWDEYTLLQLERGDEALAAIYGIDIRILDFLEWDSDDSIDNMVDLWYELEEETDQHLRTWIDGEWWSNYVDAIIGITAQVTPADNVVGCTSLPTHLDAGRICVLLKWWNHWRDDNLVQHEVSHLYYAPDDDRTQPPAPCCAMAYHPHYHSFYWEDGLWWIGREVTCAFTAYAWCSDCYLIIRSKRTRYPLRTLTITIPYGHGDTDPTPGTHIYDNDEIVTVQAFPHEHYVFTFWQLDDQLFSDNPKDVTMNSDHTLIASFRQNGSGGGGCPTLFVWNSIDYVQEGFLDIHAESDVTVQHEIQNTLALENNVKLQLRELDNYTSHIDQVKLYAVDYEGEWHLCQLKYAYHNLLGKMKHTLRFDDDSRVDLKLTEIIDLTFASPYDAAYFIFEINGYNIKTPL